jgi:hypothetical protein
MIFLKLPNDTSYKPSNEFFADSMAAQRLSAEAANVSGPSQNFLIGFPALPCLHTKT